MCKLYFDAICENQILVLAKSVIESEFRTSKMADSSHFVKNVQKIKVAYPSEMARNTIENKFRKSKMGAGSHFVNKNKKSVLI